MSLQTFSSRTFLILALLILIGATIALAGTYNPDGGTIPEGAHFWKPHEDHDVMVVTLPSHKSCPAGTNCQEWSFISENGSVGTGTYCCMGSNGQCVD